MLIISFKSGGLKISYMNKIISTSIIRCLLVFLFFLFFSRSYSQNVSFEHITQNDGLPSPTVTCIYKDSYGFMWFGTQRGLVKYDGYSYTVFDKVPSEKTVNVTNFFFKSIVQPNDSTLLIVLSYNGFYIFNIYTEKFTLVLNDVPGDWNNVYSVYIDELKNIWIATGEGLELFDLKKKSFLQYSLGNYLEFSATKTSGAVTSIQQDRLGNLWLFCINGYVGVFSVSTKKWRFIRYSNNPVSSHTLSHGGKLHFDQHHTLWIGTEYEGLFSYDTLTRNIQHYSTENHQLTSNVVMNFCEDRAQNLWIGTDGGGLLKFNRSKNTFEVFKNNPQDPFSISSNAIYYIYESDDHILWIGTYAAGVNIYKQNKQKFNAVKANGPVGYRLSYKSILSFAEAPDGSILIGTDGGGLNVFHPDTKRIECYTIENSAIHSNIITTIHFDHSGNLWLGSYGMGCCRYKFDKGIKRSSAVFLNEKSIWRIRSDSRGRLWFGSLNTLYTLSSKASAYLKEEPHLEIESPFGIINDLYIDTNDRIWMGTSSSGLTWYDPSIHEIYTLQAVDKEATSLPNTNVKSIFEDYEKQLWIGTEFGGLSKQSTTGRNKFHIYKEGSSLFRSVNGILEDDQNHMWLSTDNGIVYFNGTDEYITFSVDDGIQNKEFTAGATLKARNGVMYFGGVEGFNYFHPDSIQYNTRKPRVYITDIKLFNTSLIQHVPLNGHVYLSRPSFLTSELTLQHKDNVLSIVFAALDYTAPEQNRYAYMLEGFDQEWIFTDAGKRYVSYTNLPPGDYVFHVKASNNDAAWNTEGVSLHLHILPPWWMTWWFRILLFLILVALILAGYYVRLRNIRKKNKELEYTVAEKTYELRNVNDSLQEKNQEILITNEKLEAQNDEIVRKSEHIIEQQSKILEQYKQLEGKNTELNKLNETKNVFFSIIAHDLRNPVTAIHSLSEMLIENFRSYPEYEKEQMTQLIVDSSAHLKKLTIDLLDWAATQTQHYQVQTKPVHLYALVDELIPALSLQAEQKNILLHNELSQDCCVLADENMLATVIRNLVSNSIKYSSRGKVVRISNQKITEDRMQIDIQDEGIGMTEKQIQKLFSIDSIGSTLGTNNERGIGLGLIICKEFIVLNRGELLVNSSPQFGTIVSILLPIGFFSEETEQKAHVQQLPINPVITEVFIKEEVISYTGRKILIIDDETDMRKVLRSYLSDHFEIYEAENGEAGLYLAKTIFPEIVICDLNMPVMNGFEFCYQLKHNAETSHICCIILTGQSERNTEKRALEAGTDEFITKPYDSHFLIRRIMNQLNSRDQIRKRFSSDVDFTIDAVAQNETTRIFLDACIAYIESHLSDANLHADDLCKELGLSKTLLYEKIKNLTGQTVNEFIKTIRLKRSVELLKKGKMNISQIAIEVGFNSLSYFTRSFTKQYGKAPSEYLK